MIRIASAGLEATISPVGAELQSLRDAAGKDWLWDGDPAWWTGRAPILFPVIGVVAGGVIRIDGAEHAMPKHGIARQSVFELVAQDASSATFRLDPDEMTRAAYPFDFRLEIRFAIAGTTLEMTATVTNNDEVSMPASFGFHPAFRWPLPGGAARSDHVVRFPMPEPAPIRRIDPEGLLTPESRPTPVQGDTLRPDDEMFKDDALIFDDLASRTLWFGAPGQPGVRVDHPDLPVLGIWTKPGAPYLCLEPWQGIADPEGFAGDLRDKPGIVEIAPGAGRRFTMHITIGADG